MDKDIVAETQVVVLMGGLGTRLGLKHIPKSMANINGIPFFDYQLRLLKRWRFHKFLFLVGYQAECVREYYGDGSKWQVDIQYSYDGKGQKGTGGALKNAMGMLEKEFLLVYGDSFMDIDYQELVYRYQIEKAAGKSGLMAILHNENQFDKSNVFYQEGKLLYDKLNTNSKMQYIDYGASILQKNVLDAKEKDEKFDLSEIYTDLSKAGKLAALVVTKRFFEIGSPESMQEFCKYAAKRFCQKRKAIFFDRDGVVNEIIYNEDIEQLDSPFKKENFQYKEGIINLMLTAQRLGFYIFIVTNQPAAAKGKVSLVDLYDLNAWMVSDLKAKGIEIEFVNLCPHYPTGNLQTKSNFLIIECNCRKPKAGLLIDLLKVYNISVEDSYMVGDSYVDIIAGKQAGLKTVLIGELKCDACHRLEENYPDWIVGKLKGLEKIIKEENGYV